MGEDEREWLPLMEKIQERQVKRRRGRGREKSNESINMRDETRRESGEEKHTSDRV